MPYLYGYASPLVSFGEALLPLMSKAHSRTPGRMSIRNTGFFSQKSSCEKKWQNRYSFWHYNAIFLGVAVVNYVERRVESATYTTTRHVEYCCSGHYVERRVEVEGSKRKEVAKMLLSLFALCFSVIEISVLNL